MKRGTALLLLAILSIGFAVGIMRLLDVGISSGRHYPPFSSLRHDPLGASALRLALDEVESFDTELSLRPLRLLKGEPGVLLIAGYSRFDEKERVALERLTEEGWRVVVAFGRYSPVWEEKESALAEESESAEASEEDETEEAEEEEPEVATLSDGEFLIGKAGTPLRHAKGDLEAESVTLNEEQLDLPLPRHLPWPSQQVFEANTDWLTVYSLDGAPAVVWRKNGAGEVMALADGYHLLNEALKQDPQTHLLSWLLGANGRVVFHEHHLGLSENPGVGSLVGQYGLWPFVGGVMAWFLLLFWKNANAFGPPPPEASARGTTRGVAAGEGMARLLERHVPEDTLLDSCLNEFEESLGKRREDPRLRKRLADARVVVNEKGSVATRYNRAAEIINFRQL